MSMSPKIKEIYKAKRDKLVPGPGTYELKLTKTSPNWGIGTSQRLDPATFNKTKNLDTEPANYNPNNTLTKSASA